MAIRRNRFCQSRAAAPEPLEPRQLLALTIITHGDSPDFTVTPPEFPAWVYDMGAAIARRSGWFDGRDQNGDGIADAVQNSRVAWDGTQAPVGAGQSLDHLLLFDWAEPGGQIGTADSDQVAGSLAAAIHDRLADVESGVLDLHLIGHARGAYVNAEVLRRLAVDPLADRIGFVQMTTLDPFRGIEDGELDADPGGLVDFADNYYQNLFGGLGLSGNPLPGALNFHLNDQIAAWAGRESSDPSVADHHEIHDWYHWTIDPKVVSDTSSPELADAAIPVPSTADRANLYGSFVADLNADQVPDDFGGGASIGYYFSIAGGGIGNIVNRAGDVYTIDLKTGAIPLYLGRLYEDTQPYSIAIAPNGVWYYFSEDFRKLTRARSSFGDENEPMIVHDRFGTDIGRTSPGEVLQFREDGTLIRSRLGRFEELSTFDGTVVRSQIKSYLNFQWEQLFAFAHNDEAYEILITDLSLAQNLHRVSGDPAVADELLELPYDDITSLSVVDGLLYCIRPGSYFTINLTSLQVSDLVPVSHPAFANGLVIASLVTLRKPAWHNRELRADVNGDGRVSTNDVLAVVNRVLQRGPHAIDTSELFSMHYDTNNDGRVSTSDLLVVINHILQTQVAETQTLSQSVETQPSMPTTSLLPETELDDSRNRIAFAAAIMAWSEDEENPFCVE